MRPIDADAFKESLIGNRYGVKAIDYAIDQAPTLDVRPVVHGHWKNWKDEHTCSVCRGVVIKVWGDDEYDYCPYCGNPMDEKEEL